MNRQKQKEELEERIENLKGSLTDFASEFKGAGKNAMIIGGIVIAGIALINLFDDDDEEEQQEKKLRVESPSMVGGLVKAAISTALLAVIKDKVEEFIKKEDLEENS